MDNRGDRSNEIVHLKCNRCGEKVSSEFYPSTRPFELQATILCPPCRYDLISNTISTRDGFEIVYDPTDDLIFIDGVRCSSSGLKSLMNPYPRDGGGIFTIERDDDILRITDHRMSDSFFARLLEFFKKCDKIGYFPSFGNLKKNQKIGRKKGRLRSLDMVQKKNGA